MYIVFNPSTTVSTLTGSPSSESDYTHMSSSFVTSTPIKCNKENAQGLSPSGWSPGVVHGNSRKQFLRETYEVSGILYRIPRINCGMRLVSTLSFSKLTFR